jgi:flagellar biosynthesis/type III secretory pathway M-ring protein FliF/YscJ
VDSADIISKEDKEKVSIPEEQVNEIKTWKYSNYVVYGLIFIMVVLAIFKLVRHFRRRY